MLLPENQTSPFGNTSAAILLTNHTQSRQCNPTNGLFLTIGYSIVLAVGVPGNTIVLWTFRQFWKRGSIIELLISYLALFNLLSSIIDPLMFGYWILTCHKSWHFGWFACKIVPSLCRIFSNISIALILIMAIDRCCVIVFPMRRRLNRGRVHWLVLAAILVGLASEIHHINGSFINANGLCKIVDVDVPTYMYPSIVIISLRLLLIIFVLFFTTLLAHIKLRNASRKKLLRRHSMSVNNRCKKVTSMLVAMAAVFSITVLPRDLFHLIYIISWADGDGILVTKELTALNSVLKLLQTSNVIYNVFIYARMHDAFRKNRQMCFKQSSCSKIKTPPVASRLRRLTRKENSLLA